MTFARNASSSQMMRRWWILSLLVLLGSSLFSSWTTTTSSTSNLVEAAAAAIATTTKPRPSSPTLSSESTAAAAAPVAPPLGAVYQKSLKIPVIGHQTFRLRILSSQKAHLQIDGILEVDEVMDYRVQTCGRFAFTLSEKLKLILQKFRTSLVEVGYDQSLDLPYVVVSPPLPTKIRIPLARQPQAQVQAQVQAVL